MFNKIEPTAGNCLPVVLMWLFFTGCAGPVAIKEVQSIEPVSEQKKPVAVDYKFKTNISNTIGNRKIKQDYIPELPPEKPQQAIVVTIINNIDNSMVIQDSAPDSHQAKSSIRDSKDREPDDLWTQSRDGEIEVPRDEATSAFWWPEFEDVCGQTTNSMTFSVADLKILLDKGEKLNPYINSLEESPHKVYRKRLDMCRSLYAFVLEFKLLHQHNKGRWE